MVTRSIVGRFLILAILIVAVGVAAQAALILTDGGKKAVKTASATSIATPKGADQAESQAGDPVRVVYPGPLGDTTASKPKLADAATASPLAGPAPQTTAKLAQAMSAAAPQPAIPAPASASQPASAVQPVALVPVVASTDPDDPAPAPLSPPTPAQSAAAAHPAAPAGVEVASLGGGAPQADSSVAGGININTATVDSLNRLGGGHIGQSIAKHRPYQSVEDLVTKRVLRRSVYNQIKNQLAAK